MVITKELSYLLCCPDDKADLAFQDESFICNSCKRRFQVKGNIIDFSPKEKFLVEEKGNVGYSYQSYYEDLISRGKSDRLGTFGLASKSVPAGFVNETISHLCGHIKHDQVVCDIGAGSGDYSVELAGSCKTMFHCDLDMNGINLAQKKAFKKNITNIVFVRCDYFKLPFKQGIVNLAYVIDVIERGARHDKLLLSEVIRILKSGSDLLFDCHSKERSKLTHVNPKSISVYSKAELLKLVSELPIKDTSIIGTGFVPQIRNWSNMEYLVLNNIAKILSFPPARWIVTCNVN